MKAPLAEPHCDEKARESNAQLQSPVIALAALAALTSGAGLMLVGLLIVLLRLFLQTRFGFVAFWLQSFLSPRFSSFYPMATAAYIPGNRACRLWPVRFATSQNR